MSRKMSILDGNEAAAAVAYRLSEAIAIYPITPSSPMGEWSDQWNSEHKKNIWGAIPDVIEMQRNLATHSAPDPGDHHQEKAALLCHRWLRGGARGGHGQSHQHHHANLLLGHQWRAPARAGHCRHQESNL
jgi:hypothetical protein